MKTSRKKRTQRDYSLAFKLQVIQEVEKGERTYKQAQSHYGIQGKSTVLVWLRKYGNLDWTLPKLRHLENKEPTPEQRIKELEAALQDERDRNLIYKTMIEIVEKEYGLPVRKKLSTKQLKNSGKRKK
jgi:transposase-like protein